MTPRTSVRAAVAMRILALLLLATLSDAFAPTARGGRPLTTARRQSVVELDITLDNGVTESVRLSSADDADAAAAEIAGRHLADGGPEVLAQLAAALRARYAVARSTYEGPAPPGGAHARAPDVEVAWGESELVLEVADSVVAPGGRGLFARVARPGARVTLDAGTALCGYASGSLRAAAPPDSAASSARDKTVATRLAELDTAVWFEGELVTLREALESTAQGGADARDVELAGHDVERDPDTRAPRAVVPRVAPVDRARADSPATPVSGEEFAAAAARDDAARADAASASAADDDDDKCYFVPDEAQTLDLMTLGQFANDLAVGPDLRGGADYEGASASANVLVLVQRLERAPPPRAHVLRPSRPIPTISRDVTIASTTPMELGCQYGASYWGAGPESAQPTFRVPRVGKRKAE